MASNIKNYDYYYNEVTLNDMCLRLVPGKYKTYDVCLAAIKNNIAYWEFIPAKYKSFEMILVLLNINPLYLIFEDDLQLLDQSQIEFLKLKYGY